METIDVATKSAKSLIKIHKFAAGIDFRKKNNLTFSLKKKDFRKFKRGKIHEKASLTATTVCCGNELFDPKFLDHPLGMRICCRTRESMS